MKRETLFDLEGLRHIHFVAFHECFHKNSPVLLFKLMDKRANFLLMHAFNKPLIEHY